MTVIVPLKYHRKRVSPYTKTNKKVTICFYPLIALALVLLGHFVPPLTSSSLRTQNDVSITETKNGTDGGYLDSNDDYAIADYWSHLKCADLFAQKRPIHPQSVWSNARRTYVNIVGSDRSTIGDPESPENAFAVPGIVVEQANEKGRGIFTTETIPEGALMYHFGRTAQFQDGRDYRRFIMELPVDVACDVLQWAYVQYISVDNDDDGLRIMVDLDEGAFCNDGWGGKTNFGYLDDKRQPINNGVRPLYAKRKILAGEEILCNYAEFSEGDWQHFGLQ